MWAIPFSALWLVGEPLRAKPTNLADRLEAARRRIEASRVTAANEARARTALLRARIDNAEQVWNSAIGLLNSVVPTLNDLNLTTKPQKAPAQSAASSVLWGAYFGLHISSSTREFLLKLQARVLEQDLDHIDWRLSVEFVPDFADESFGGPFLTRWNEDPTAAIEERLGRFADALPEIVAALTAN